MSFAWIVEQLARQLFRLFLLFTIMLAVTKLAGAAENSRIASIGGAITEIIYALEEQGRLVATDTTSVYPREAQKLPKAGYQRTLSAEGLIAQKPELLVATDMAGPPAVLSQLRHAGVETHIIPENHSYEGLIEKIRILSEMLDVPEKGETLINTIELRMETIREQLIRKDKHSKPASVVFLLSAGQGPLMAAGNDTAANAVIKMAGGINPLESVSGYKPVSAESLISANPDYILVTHRTMKMMGRQGILDVPGVKFTSAARNDRIIAMDGLMLLGFTPRLPDAIGELHDHINL